MVVCIEVRVGQYVHSVGGGSRYGALEGERGDYGVC